MTAERDVLLQSLRAGGRFFDLVRLIEQLVGPRFEEHLEFAHDPDLTFPVNDVVRVTVDQEGNRYTLVCTFLGLTGTASPLTPHFTEQVLHSDEDGALRAFYDVFHSVLLRMLYRSWKTASLAGSLDETGDSVLFKRCATFVGQDPWSGAPDKLPLVAVTGLADHPRGRPQSIDPAAATAMFERLFKLSTKVTLPTKVTFGQRRFVTFSDDDVNELGAQNTTLGEDLVYGIGCFDASTTVRIVIGPVAENVCDWLMPESEGHAVLSRVCERIFGAKAHVEVDVLVGGREVPACALGDAVGAMLGIDAFVTGPLKGLVCVRVPLGDRVSATARTYFDLARGARGGAHVLDSRK